MTWCEWPVYDIHFVDKSGLPHRRFCARSATSEDRAVNLCPQHEEMWWREMTCRVATSDSHSIRLRGRDRLRAALLQAEEASGIDWMSNFFSNVQLGETPEQALAHAAASVISGRRELGPYEKALIDGAIEQRMQEMFG